MSGQYDVAILGAGPVGLEAALRSAEDGRKTVLIERGSTAQSVRDWGHVRMFTPFGMNSSERGRAAVGGGPDVDAVLSGRELAEDYLDPLARAAERAGVERLGGCVTDVRREGWPKGRGLGEAARAESPLIVHADGDCVKAGAVLDCTGTFTASHGEGWDFARPQEYPVTPPAVDASEVAWGPVDPSAIDPAWKNGRVLVVGSGYTAATDVVLLHGAGVPVVWLTRRDTPQPVDLVEGDPLPRRQELVDAANALADDGRVDWRSGHTVTSVKFDPPTGPTAAPRRVVTARGPEGDVRFDGDSTFAAVLFDTGFRPDTSLFRELHVHLCYATEGPMKLAAHLMGGASDDCLTQTGSDAELLKTPEPGFFVLGAKSYGRRSNFLLRAGLEQVAAVFDELI